MGKPRRRPQEAPEWTEAKIAGLLARQLFSGRSVLVVPCCSWAGHEADLLVVHPSLRLVDVEIKVSRADFRADAKKDKWWHTRPWSRRLWAGAEQEEREPRLWPDKVWKHYYAVPAEIWDDSMLTQAASPKSGILLLQDPDRGHREPWLRVKRNARPSKDAQPIGAADAVDIARLASLRMWSAKAELERTRSTQGEQTCLPK